MKLINLASYLQQRRSMVSEAPAEGPPTPAPRVRFSPSLYYDHHLDELPRYECSPATPDSGPISTWYTLPELNVIWRENQKTLQRYQRKKVDYNYHHSHRYTIRGLEALTGRERKKALERQAHAVRVVLEAQHQQQSMGSIAQQYQAATQQSRVDAILNGLRDEKAVGRVVAGVVQHHQPKKKRKNPFGNLFRSHTSRSLSTLETCCGKIR